MLNPQQLRFVFACTVLALGVVACSPSLAERPQEFTKAAPINQPEPTPLPTRAVVARNSVVADGVLALAAPPLAVNFDTTAKVTAVNAVVGQQVKRGAVLATVDDTALQDAVEDAKLNLDQVEAQIRQQAAPTAKEDIDAAQAALNAAAASYNTTKAGATASEIEQARMSWESAKTQYLSAQSSRDSVCSRDNQSNACQQQEASYGNAYESMITAYARYQKVLEPVSKDKLTQANASVVSAKARLDALKTGKSDLQKQYAQAQYDAAQSALARAQDNLRKATLIAPCDCWVQEANVVVGSTPTNTAFLLVNLTGMQFKTTNLSERDVANIKPGAPASIRLKAYDDAFAGKVGAVLAQASGSQSGAALFTVLVELDPTDKLLLPGMTGQAEIAFDAT